jgi:hypothetical protein
MQEEMKQEVEKTEEKKEGYPQLTEAQLQKLCKFFGCSPETLIETIEDLPTEDAEEEQMARSMFPSLKE